MPTILCNFAILMVAGLFYAWRAYNLRRLRTLRERVTYMLWVMSQSDDPAAVEQTPATDGGLTAART